MGSTCCRRMYGDLQPPQLSEKEALAAACKNSLVPTVAASGGVHPERDNSSSTSDSSRNQIIRTLTSSPDMFDPPGARAAPVQPLPFKMPPENPPMAKRIKLTSTGEAHALGWHPENGGNFRKAAFKAPPPKLGKCLPYKGIVAEQVAAQQGHPKAPPPVSDETLIYDID